MVDILGKLELRPGVRVSLMVSKGCFTHNGGKHYIMDCPGAGDDCYYKLFEEETVPLQHTATSVMSDLIFHRSCNDILHLQDINCLKRDIQL